MIHSFHQMTDVLRLDMEDNELNSGAEEETTHPILACFLQWLLLQ